MPANMNQTTVNSSILPASAIRHIRYGFSESPFGKILLGVATKGICCVSLATDETAAWHYLRKKFPEAILEAESLPILETFSNIFENKPVELCFELQGTPFQHSVWNALLKIPFGQTTTYGAIAAQIGNPKAVRAVGSAVGANPIFYAIPCHRVLPASGEVGNYYWGPMVKKALLDWEKSKIKTYSTKNTDR